MNVQYQIEAISPYHQVRARQADLSPTGARVSQRDRDTAWQIPRTGVYRRSKRWLPPEAIADLEEYYAHLRSYYGIPDSEPVFPSRSKKKIAKQTASIPCIATGKNRNDHPWRTT